MDTWLEHFFGWLPEGGIYNLLIGLIAYLESIVALGLLVPGSVLVVCAGFLCAHGKGIFVHLMIAACTGAILGDLTSFWLGARLGPRLQQLRPMQKRLDMLRRAELFFTSHGGKSVFFGRFLGPLRGFIPFVAGGAHMSPGWFIGYTLVSGIGWGVVYPGMGYLGGASWHLVQIWTGRLGLLFVALLSLAVLNSLFWNRLAPPLGRSLVRCWTNLRSKASKLGKRPPFSNLALRYPQAWAFLAERFSLKRGSGLYLTAGFVVSALFAALFLTLAGSLFIQGPLQAVDLWAYEAVQFLQHRWADILFVAITSFASLPVISILGALLLLWLVLHNRDFSAVILLVGMAGGSLLVLFSKSLFLRARPEPLLAGVETFSNSFPSAHAFIALLFYGLAVYMLLDTVENLESRFNLVLAGSLWAVLIGFSRLYLGVHWASDVLAGFALAAVWLTFLVTASEIRRRYGGEFPWHIGWKPRILPRRTRIVAMLAASSAASAGIVFLLLDRIP